MDTSTAQVEARYTFEARVAQGASPKLRNLERKAPKHVLPEIRDDFHRVVYAASLRRIDGWRKIDAVLSQDTTKVA